MGRRRRAATGPITAWVVVVAAVVLPLIAGLHLLTRDDYGRIHEAPVAVVAPLVVGEQIADQVDDLPGRPFRAYAMESDAEAMDALRHGDVVAVAHLHLGGTSDQVVVHRARSRETNTAIERAATQALGAWDRSATVTRIGPRSAPSEWAVRATVGAMTLLAYLVVAVLSVWRGRRVVGFREAAIRAALGTAVATAAGLIVALGPWWGSHGSWWTITVVCTASALATAAFTAMLEALFGALGLLLTASLFVVSAAPFLTSSDLYLFPAPWHELAGVTLAGATGRALTETVIYDNPLPTGPLLVVAGWLAIAVFGLTVARRWHPGTDLPVAGGGLPWRLRVLLAVTPLIAGVLALGSLAPATTAAGVARPAASSGECAPFTMPRTVPALNRTVRDLRGDGAFQGADVGADIRLQDGRRLWVFGDTLRGSGFDGPDFVRNSMLILDDRCLRVVLPGDRGAVIPDRSLEVGYWPMSLALRSFPGYDLVAVTSERVRSTGTERFDFQQLGPAVALFVVPRGGTPQHLRTIDVGDDSSEQDVPAWGAAAATQGEWVYLYGTFRPAGTTPFGFALSVARSHTDDLLHPERWTYWDGASWNPDPASAGTLIPAPGGVSRALSVFRRGDTWYALSKRDEFLGADVVVWTAPAPQGPFTARPPVAHLPSDLATGELRYMPLAHPGLLPRPGTMLVSYSRSVRDLSQAVAEPYRYRPQFVRVVLPTP